VLAQSPEECCLLRLDRIGGLSGEDGTRELNRAFECRAWNSRADMSLRISAPGAPASAVLLHDGAEPIQDPFEELDSEEVTILDRRGYILWGHGGAVVKSGGRFLKDQRIGDLWVPLECGEGDRVTLPFVEYLRTAEDGNVVVAAERLLPLEVIP
jgi:CRISPR-associated protein (TIGR03984 family)